MEETKYYREVKCSDRLPKEDRDKTDYCLILENGCIGADYILGTSFANYRMKDIKAWLEPIPSPPVDREQILKILSDLRHSRPLKQTAKEKDEIIVDALLSKGIIGKREVNKEKE